MAKKPTIQDVLKELADRVLKLEDDNRKIRAKLRKFENKTVGGFAQYLSPRDMGTQED